MAKQKRYSAQLKFQVVLESLQRKRPDAEIARAYGVHPITLAKWKKQFLRHVEIRVARGVSKRKSRNSSFEQRPAPVDKTRRCIRAGIERATRQGEPVDVIKVEHARHSPAQFGGSCSNLPIHGDH